MGSLYLLRLEKKVLIVFLCSVYTFCLLSQLVWAIAGVNNSYPFLFAEIIITRINLLAEVYRSICWDLVNCGKHQESVPTDQYQETCFQENGIRY